MGMTIQIVFILTAKLHNLSCIFPANHFFFLSLNDPSSPTATSGWKEYDSKDASGNAIDTGLRSRCGKVLTASEAEAYSSREAVLGF